MDYFSTFVWVTCLWRPNRMIIRVKSWFMESNPQLELAYDFLEYTEWTCFLQEKRERKNYVSAGIETEITQKDDCGCSHGVAAIKRGWGDDPLFLPVAVRPYVPGSSVRWSEVKNCNTRTSLTGKRSILSRRLICWWLTRSVWYGQICWMRWMICCVVTALRTSLSVGCSCCWSVICSSWLPWWKRTSGRCWNSITHRRSFSIVRLWQPPLRGNRVETRL